MKIKFREARLNKANKERLVIINSIIEEYQKMGYKMTLRQLYYQLVSRDIIPNVQAEYAKLSKLLKEGRMSGQVDWDSIEDRLRVPYVPYFCDSPSDAMDDVINQYRLNRQIGQQTYLEVWVEKDSLSSVLKVVTSKYHVNLLVNRGYGSVTAMYDAYRRYYKKIEKGGEVKILYLGDHDPSGIDMIRDIGGRIGEMLGDYSDSFIVEPIALTSEQIEKYRPPPNPAKKTDPRAKKYFGKYGNTSWEVDALNPQILHKLVADKIEENIDLDMFNNMLYKEEDDKEVLRNAQVYLEDNEE